MITKQITLTTRLAEIFDDEKLEETFLMEFVHTVLAGRLSGETNEKEITEKFLEVMGEKSQ